MSSTPVLAFTGKRCLPIFDFRGAKQIPVTLAPGTYAAGTVIGAINGSNVNDVQTITVDSSTHSTITLKNLPGGLSYTAVQDVTPTALQTALNALLGYTGYAVTGTYVGGSGGTYILTGAGALAARPLPVIVPTATFVGGSSPAIANVHTTTGVGPNYGYGAYADANSDGTGVATGILEYGCYVDPTGAIWYGNVSGPVSEFGQSELTTPMWYCGDFDIADLTGLDAAGLADMQGSVKSGTIASAKGLIHIG